MAIIGDLRYLAKYSSIQEMIEDSDIYEGRVVFVEEGESLTIFSIGVEEIENAIRLKNGLWAVKVLTNNEQSLSVRESYTTSVPILVSVGGIAAGTQFSNAKWTDIFNQMFYPKEAEGFDVSTDLSTNYYLHGEIVTVHKVIISNVKMLGIKQIVITATVNGKTQEIYNQMVEEQLQYVCDVYLLTTEQADITVSIVADRTVSETVTIYFGYPAYYGVLPDVKHITSTMLQTLNKRIIAEEGFDLVFSTNKSYIVIAVDSATPIESILEKSDIDVTDNFEVRDVNVYFSGTGEEMYKVYVSNITSVQDWLLKINMRKEALVWN